MRYAGDLTPREAFELVAQQPDGVLVDVRTRAEWRYVGVPDLSSAGRPVVLVEWQTFPDGRVNAGFVADLAAAGVSPDAPVAFICRSGVRSVAAATAATTAGFASAYNVLEGFEGPLDAEGHRGRAAGWKAAGLPWRQT
jgi:rhodanese-related sulfurtransferase